MLFFQLSPLAFASLIVSFLMSTVALILFIAYYLLCHEFEDETKPLTRYPFISVIMPAYNEGEGIKEGIESVIEQDYPKDRYELIVVDDGSTDNTYEVAKRYEKMGVKVIKKKNGGAADAKNVGLRYAKGEIIVTMDSDTVMAKDVLMKIAKKFEFGKVDAVTTGIRVKNKDNLIEWMQYLEYDNTIFLRRILAFLNAIFVTPGGCSAYSKKILDACGGFDTKSLTEDQEIAFHIQKLGGRIDALLSAIVYTKVPSTLNGLMKQRTRWLKGGIYNKLKYRELLNPKYGDFVFFAFFFDLFFLITFFLSTWWLWDRITHLGDPFYFIERIGVFNILLFTPDPFFFVTLFLLPISLWWFGKTVNTIRRFAGDKELSLKEYLLLPFYFLFFSYVYFVAQIIAIYEFFTGKYYNWGTR